MGPVAMRASQLHYLPLSPTIYFLLVALFVVLVVLIQVQVLRYTYERLGLSPPVALLLLLGSLLGSAINIPVAELPGQPILSGRARRAKNGTGFPPGRRPRQTPGEARSFPPRDCRRRTDFLTNSEHF